MQFSLLQQIRTSEVVALFKDVFSASEGDAEGQLIADFVSKLIATTDPIDLICCVAEKNDTIVGCIFFSRFTVPNEQSAFILSPVAVSTDVQGQGIGQQLIQYGLAHLKAMHIDLVFTYGDPNYYSKTGFYQINEDIVKAPIMTKAKEGSQFPNKSKKPKTFSGLIISEITSPTPKIIPEINLFI